MLTGYTPEILRGLAETDEKLTVVAGHLSTWFGKEAAGRPTVFAAIRDEATERLVASTTATVPELADYVSRIDPDLMFASPPAFSSTNVFFMAGEGNLHPKHVAYFLPEDEGVRGSPYKKTYYFNNTHRAYVSSISLPLYEQYAAHDQICSADSLDLLPALGVRAHDLGHSVNRAKTTFRELNRRHRWESVLLQETAADVFGALFITDVWPKHFQYSAEEGVAYFLAECLRYVDRGLGLFPDSDGMFLQLNYLQQHSYLHIDRSPSPRLRWDPQEVVRGLQALARVLADVVLSGDAGAAVAFHHEYGPSNRSALSGLLTSLESRPMASIEYLQEHVVSEHSKSTEAA